MIIFLPLKCLW